MFVTYARFLTGAVVLALAGAGNTAYGQWFNNCCCCCPPPICVRPAYQTVPVTEYRECRQIVQKPVVDTTYVDQPITEYRQVVENKTCEVPTVSYQPVTEYHTVQRDCGRWTTQYHQRAKMHPCQYDCRPDLFGFLNRTQYSVRMAFTPDFYAERLYVPNVVTQQIPVTRQVAVRGTQTVNYQVAKVVPITTTRRVAVNTVRMVAEEVVTQRPVTVMKVVPFGSTLALGAPAGGPRTALQPTPEGRVHAIGPRHNHNKIAAPDSPEREARRSEIGGPESIDGAEENDDSIRRRQGSLGTPVDIEPMVGKILPASGWKARDKSEERPVGRWVARRKTEPIEGPAMPEIIVASTSK